jgi:hypothetical protein
MSSRLDGYLSQQINFDSGPWVGGALRQKVLCGLSLLKFDITVFGKEEEFFNGAQRTVELHVERDCILQSISARHRDKELI